MSWLLPTIGHNFPMWTFPRPHPLFAYFSLLTTYETRIGREKSPILLPDFYGSCKNSSFLFQWGRKRVFLFSLLLLILSLFYFGGIHLHLIWALEGPSLAFSPFSAISRHLEPLRAISRHFALVITNCDLFWSLELPLYLFLSSKLSVFCFFPFSLWPSGVHHGNIIRPGWFRDGFFSGLKWEITKQRWERKNKKE